MRDLPRSVAAPARARDWLVAAAGYRFLDRLRA
jgi:hypothetical protein